MKATEMQQSVTRIIRWQLGVKKKRVVATAKLVEDLGADGLTMLRVAMDLEEAFCLEILSEEVEKFRTVQNVFDYIAKRLKLKG